MNILLVSAYYPNDMSFGAAQRTTHMHRALQQVGSVTTLVLREGQPAAVKRMPAPNVIAEVGYPEPPPWGKYGRSAPLASLLRDVMDLDEFDVTVGRYLGPLLALPPRRGRSVVDADDAYYCYPPGNGRVASLIGSVKTRARAAVGRAALRRVDHSWFCCERDLSHFQLKSASVLPNVVGATSVDASSVVSSDPVVLMVGALWYRPNREAIERFLLHCWPDIRRQMPNAKFRAVGAAPPELRAAWASQPGVECPGFVDDLAAEYRRARLTVVPVRFGGGTQIKAIESLAHGRVPVVSTFVASGFTPHLRHGESLRVADDADGIIEAVVGLLKDPATAIPMAQRGQEIVRASFSQMHFDQHVGQTVRVLSTRT